MSSQLFLLATLNVLVPSAFLTPSAMGATHVVPDNQPTIQAAIDSAASGDTVLVRAGTYIENLETQGKILTLKGLDGPENTIIDGNHQGSVLLVTGDAWIEGFTIQNGQSESGGGIFVKATSEPLTVRICKNIIRDNRAGYQVDQGFGGGIDLYIVENSMVEENTIENNYAGDSGGGISVSGNCILKNNIISGNGCHVGGGGILSGRGTEIANNLIINNWADSFGGGIDGAAETIRSNTIVRNYINNSSSLQGAGVHLFSSDGSPQVERNIVAQNYGAQGPTGVGIKCSSFQTITLGCNDVWGNDVDYQIVSGCDTTGLGNISADPKFCDSDASNFEIESNSPCAPENSSCGLIGKYPVGCTSVPVRTTTWGALKTLFDGSSGRK